MRKWFYLLCIVAVSIIWWAFIGIVSATQIFHFTNQLVFCKTKIHGVESQIDNDITQIEQQLTYQQNADGTLIISSKMTDINKAKLAQMTNYPNDTIYNYYYHFKGLKTQYIHAHNE